MGLLIQSYQRTLVELDGEIDLAYMKVQPFARHKRFLDKDL